MTAGLVVAVLALAWIWTKNSTVAQTPVGGVTVAGTPSAVIPLPPTGVTATVVSVTPDTTGLTKKIIIIKDVTAMPGVVSSYLNIGEVYAYAGSRLLTSSDFSDAIVFPDVYTNPNDHIVPIGSGSNAIDGKPETVTSTGTSSASFTSITLVLTKPIKLTQVNVLNRQDCCWDRLNGAVIMLINEAGTVLFKQPLHGVRDLQLFPVS